MNLEKTSQRSTEAIKITLAPLLASTAILNFYCATPNGHVQQLLTSTLVLLLIALVTPIKKLSYFIFLLCAVGMVGVELWFQLLPVELTMLSGILLALCALMDKSDIVRSVYGQNGLAAFTFGLTISLFSSDGYLWSVFSRSMGIAEWIHPLRGFAFNGAFTLFALSCFAIALVIVARRLKWSSLFVLTISIIVALVWVPVRGNAEELCMQADRNSAIILFATSILLTWSQVIGWVTVDSKPRSTRTIALTIAMSISAFVGGGLQDYFGKQERSVAFFNRGGFDWTEPSFKSHNVGMFTFLPRRLRNAGYQVDLIDSEDLNAESLEGIQSLVLINCPKIWSENEREIIHNFMERGGSVLVLGDHTDVFGMMKGFNSLCDRYGISFNFDSAYPPETGWHSTCLIPNRSTFNQAFRKRIGSAIGASLKVEAPATPVLVGHHGFADNGNAQNYVGSFLGNYKLDQDEKCGDTVLAAMSSVGHGKLMVFADTSLFQGSMVYAFDSSVLSIFEWLTTKQNRWLVLLLHACGIAGALVLIGGLFLCYSIENLFAVCCASFAGLGIVAAAGNLRLPDTEQHEASALIDRTHVPRTGFYDSGYNSIGSAYSMLHRCGYITKGIHQWNPPDIEKTPIILIVAPIANYTQSQVDQLVDAEKRGCKIILCANHTANRTIGGLLEIHGLKIGAAPIGKINSEQVNEDTEASPRFREPYGILVDGSAEDHTEVLYQQDSLPIVTYSKLGDGGLLLISDARFFSSMNQERGFTFRSKENLIFFESIAHHIQIVDGSNQMRWKSPPKVQ